MNSGKLLILAFAAIAACRFAHAAVEKESVLLYEDYGAAMKSTDEKPLAAVWQRKNASAVAEATADDVLAGFAACPEAAKGLLSKLRGAYEGDPVVLVQVAAVSQWVMEADPCWIFFWRPSRSAGRKVWTEALLETAEHAQDPYVAVTCLDQLRWCGPRCAAAAARVRAIGEKSSDRAVKDMAGLAARAMSGCCRRSAK